MHGEGSHGRLWNDCWGQAQHRGEHRLWEPHLIDSVFGTALICHLLKFLTMIGYVAMLEAHLDSFNSSEWSTRSTLLEETGTEGGLGGGGGRWEEGRGGRQRCSPMIMLPHPTTETLQSNSPEHSPQHRQSVMWTVSEQFSYIWYEHYYF